MMRSEKCFFGLVVIVNLFFCNVSIEAAFYDSFVVHDGATAAAEGFQAHALAARTPQAFKRHKLLAIASELLAGALPIAIAYDAVKNDREVVGLFSLLWVFYTITRVKRHWSHLQNADQLCLALQDASFKELFNVKDWRTVAFKRTRDAFLLCLASIITFFGMKKMKNTLNDGSLFGLFLLSQFGSNFLSSHLIDEHNAVGVETVFDRIIRENKRLQAL